MAPDTLSSTMQPQDAKPVSVPPIPSAHAVLSTASTPQNDVGGGTTISAWGDDSASDASADDDDDDDDDSSSGYESDFIDDDGSCVSWPEEPDDDDDWSPSPHSGRKRRCTTRESPRKRRGA